MKSTITIEITKEGCVTEHTLYPEPVICHDAQVIFLWDVSATSFLAYDTCKVTGLQVADEVLDMFLNQGYAVNLKTIPAFEEKVDQVVNVLKALKPKAAKKAKPKKKAAKKAPKRVAKKVSKTKTKRKTKK